MRKILGSIFIVLLVFVGIFGVDIRFNGNLITIHPYISKMINSKVVTGNYKSLKAFLKENIVTIAKDKNSTKD